MSTRRPRISVKPNLGRKTDGAAAPAARKPTPVPAPSPAPAPAPSPAPPPAPPPPAESPPPELGASEQPATAPTEERPEVRAEESSPEPPVAAEPAPAVAEPPPVTRASKRPLPVSPPPHSPPKVARASLSSASKEAPPPPPREPSPPPAEAPPPPPPPPEESPSPVRSTSPESRPRKAEKKVQRSRSKTLRKLPADRSAMTMQDLIYYNPPGNPMQEKAAKGPRQDGAEDSGSTRADEEAVEDVEPVTEQQEEPEEEEEEEEREADAGPRVRLGPNGEITLDEESLVIRRPAAKPVARVVYETGGETSYKSFRKQPTRRQVWTAKQTARFYRALSVCGTDFTLMATFFPSRTRQELKNKFKREERCNRELVDRAITDPTQFDMEGLEDEEPDEPEKPEKPARRRRGGGQQGSRSSSRRSRKTTRSSSTGSPVAEEEEEEAVEEVVEEEIVQDEITLEDEAEESGETASSATPPPPQPPAQQQPQDGQIPPLRLQAGQLVFYASRTEEQVVHVFVVAPPQQAVVGSELASRLSAPPLQGPFPAQPSAAAS